MQWLRSKPSSQVPEVQSIEECTTLMARDLVILFKHSPACPVSWMAHREVVKFLAGQPDAPIYLISVRQRRDIAVHIEQVTGIRHESPQIIVLRGGKVIGDASHDDVTAELLAKLSGPQMESEAFKES